jgi:hypothetical protein
MRARSPNQGNVWLLAVYNRQRVMAVLGGLDGGHLYPMQQVQFFSVKRIAVAVPPEPEDGGVAAAADTLCKHISTRGARAGPMSYPLAAPPSDGKKKGKKSRRKSKSVSPSPSTSPSPSPSPPRRRRHRSLSSARHSSKRGRSIPAGADNADPAATDDTDYRQLQVHNRALRFCFIFGLPYTWLA